MCSKCKMTNRNLHNRTYQFRFMSRVHKDDRIMVFSPLLEWAAAKMAARGQPAHLAKVSEHTRSPSPAHAGLSTGERYGTLDIRLGRANPGYGGLRDDESIWPPCT